MESCTAGTEKHDLYDKRLRIDEQKSDIPEEKQLIVHDCMEGSGARVGHSPSPR